MVGGALGGLGTSIGATIYLDLNAPPVLEFIRLYVPPFGIAPDPELKSEVLASGIRLSWDDRAIGWRLQLSPDLSGWTNSGPVISAAGFTVLSTTGVSRTFARLAKP